MPMIERVAVHMMQNDHLPTGDQSMTKTIHGRAHGRTIELDEDLGVPDGQEVLITVQTVPTTAPGSLPPGEGLRRAFGAWARETEEVDTFLAWNREQRKIGRGRADD
jgi:hypothetical protein